MFRMIRGMKIVVVMPAYNAEKTLRRTWEELPHELLDEVLLVDDASADSTVRVARELGLQVVVHPENAGYGANQKTCYREALRLGADIVVMIHPDYQYSPRLVPAMVSMILSGHFDVVLGSRILGGQAIQGGMPVYKYVANRLLTFFGNLALGVKLSEYHTGFRAFRREVLETVPLDRNSDDVVFDNQILAQTVHFGFRIGEISCPTRYFPEASSIDLRRSIRYGFGVLATTTQFLLKRSGVARPAIFERPLENGKDLEGKVR